MANKFRKLVAVEPIRFDRQAVQKLSQVADEVICYQDSPASQEEMLRRIGDADAVLVFYTSTIGAWVMERCPNLRYIGMCCSLYTPESANVDIQAAHARGITVTGIRRYGDQGVPEFIISELVRLFHGFGGAQFRPEPMELAGARVGVIGMGDVGSLVADALRFFHADVCYFSRTRKPEAEARGICYLPLPDLLKRCDVVTTHLHKHTVLMDEQALARLGNGKVLINTTFTPPYPLEALEHWLKQPGNFYIGDTAGAIGGVDGPIFSLPNVICPDRIAGESVQSGQLLREKVLDNLRRYLEET